jgi:hypothetical protein
LVWPPADSIVDPESNSQGEDDHQIVRSRERASDRPWRVFGQVLRSELEDAKSEAFPADMVLRGDSYHRRRSNRQTSQKPPRIEHVEIGNFLQRAPDEEKARHNSDGKLSTEKVGQGGGQKRARGATCSNCIICKYRAL